MAKTETLAAYKRRIAQAGGNGRAKALTPDERRRIARKAAAVRWKKKRTA